METLGTWRHICVDMQRLFHEDTPWHVPWMRRALPQVAEIADFARTSPFSRAFCRPTLPPICLFPPRRFYRSEACSSRHR